MINSILNPTMSLAEFEAAIKEDETEGFKFSLGVVNIKESKRKEEIISR
jgi:hypothetical protein